MTADDSARARASALAHAALARGEPLAWFEALYRGASGDAAAIPWADLAPHPAIVRWLDAAGPLAGRRAIVVGCGLGDDAVEVARRGAVTTAFDLSDTAVAWCRRRFPDAPVAWTTADLLATPAAWRRAFDLVVEVFTIQSMPPALRERAIAAVADLLAPGGRLVVVARTRGEDEAAQGPPWPLTPRELEGFTRAGLTRAGVETWQDAAAGRPPGVGPGAVLASFTR